MPKVYALFAHQPKHKKQAWAYRVTRLSGNNPLLCILCQKPMRLSGLRFGLSSKQLMHYQYERALRKPIKVLLG